VGAATLSGTRAATQTASLDVTDQANLKVTQIGLGAAKQASDAFLKKAIKDKEIQDATDLLDEANSYYEATRTFEKQYQMENQGKDAREADKAYAEWHEKQYNQRSMRFAGDPRTQYMWKQQAGQIRMSSMGRGMNYSLQENERYKKQVTAQKTDLYYQKVAEAPTDQAVNNLRIQYNAEIAALQPPEVVDVMMAEADQKTAETRINTAIAKNDVEEAKRLLGEYREAGVLGNITDEMTKKVTDADIEDQAFQISEVIRLTMPEATKQQKLEQVRKLSKDNPDIYKSARYQVIQDHSESLSLRKEQENLIRDQFDTAIFEAKTPAQREDVKQQIMATPMPEPLRTEMLKKNAQGLKQPLQSDDARLNELERRVAAESITQDELDREYKWYLSPQDYKMQSTRLKETGGNRVNAYNLDMEERLTRAFAEDGKKKKEKTKRMKAAMNQFVDEYMTNNGRMPTNQEMKGQEDWLMEQVIYDEDIWFHETTERFMVDTLDPSKFDVPDKNKAEIRSQLKRAGIEPTDEQIIEIYREYLQDKSQFKRE
jgi:hypothetical protein